MQTRATYTDPIELFDPRRDARRPFPSDTEGVPPSPDTVIIVAAPKSSNAEAVVLSCSANSASSSDHSLNSESELTLQVLRG